MASQQKSIAPITRWKVCAGSQRGAAHVFDQRPNQDSFSTNLPGNGLAPSGSGIVVGECGQPMIIAVSDGHGDPQSFRSDRGSRFAVEIVVELLQEMADQNSHELCTLARDAREMLPRQLKRRWQRRVTQDLADDPIEMSPGYIRLQNEDPDGYGEVNENRELIYGTTCGAVLITDRYLLLLMLGDPNIVLFGDQLEPFEPLKKLQIGGTTTVESLCENTAPQQTMIAFLPVLSHPPLMVCLSTDGVINSFARQTGFTNWLLRRLKELQSESNDWLAENLPQLLRQLTEMGSGDDVSFIVVKRCDIPTKPENLNFELPFKPS